MLIVLLLSLSPAAAPPVPPADLILHGGNVVTLDRKSSVAQAVAVRGGRIVAVGTDEAVRESKGPMTTLIDLKGRTLMPGLYDSHVHPVGVVTTQLAAPPPLVRSLVEANSFIRKSAATLPKGDWIVLRYAFPTRLEEGRFPTKGELDAVAPDHPVLFHAGPASMVNSKALEISKITRDTPSPKAGMIVMDPKTGEPTGMIRNAYSALRGVPREGDKVGPKELREGVLQLFRRYNERGLTSIADRAGSQAGLDLYRDLARAGELTLRVNVSRQMSAGGSLEEIVRRLDAVKDGPTGVGDDRVRVGPIKLFLDGGMTNGTAYMRQPWPPGPTYQITEKDYRGLLFIEPAQLRLFVEEASRRKWQVTAHTAGEGAMDVLLDAYESVDRIVPVKGLRHCITHANFPSRHNLERCRTLGVCADVQPAWLYKDGPTLARILSEGRMRWFQPYRTWLEYTTIGGGSDHMLRYDALDSTNPWDPWLGIWIALARKTQRDTVLGRDEALTREQALRLYTINNAYLHHEEKTKGTVEVGKLADLIVLDRDVMTCPVDEVRGTKVLRTIVGGKTVYERK
jgi:predicted amidohydrolase YtcJ